MLVLGEAIIAKRSFYTELAFYHREAFYHTDAFPPGSFFTNRCLYRRRAYTEKKLSEKLLHTDAFAHRYFYDTLATLSQKKRYAIRDDLHRDSYAIGPLGRLFIYTEAFCYQKSAYTIYLAFYLSI